MLAAAGLGSRRDMEALIVAGEVSVNGKVVGIGERIHEGDRVRVKGREVRIPWGEELPQVIIYHKPEGEIVSRDDPEGRASVFEKLPRVRGKRWISVGRLDLNTEGLLVFTTSGELANRLSHPRYEVEREYAVRIMGDLTIEQMQSLTSGIELEDGTARAQSIMHQGGEGLNQWYRLVILEGRNREVRRLFEALGLSVSRLIRVRFGPINMPPRLKRGMYEALDERDVRALLKWCGIETARQAPSGHARGAARFGKTGLKRT
jgi:23S rRNA pseudouridine2605 synthase